MRVKFVKDAQFESDGRNAGHTFKAGESYDFDQDFAERWVRRGLAEVVGDDGKAVEPASRFTPVETPKSAVAKSDTKEDADKKADSEKAEADKAVHTHKTAAR